MNQEQRELATKHGTPSEFENAVWAAWAQLFVTTDEAIAAIRKYRANFNAAGPSQDERLREALSHEVTCPCSYCKEMWDIVDPDGERILPGEEPQGVS